jgi:hypothetical protein
VTSLTPKMVEALGLLVEHGNGDIAHDRPTQLVHGTPTINLRTALALDKLGYVNAFEEPSWQLWGGIELKPAGQRMYLLLVQPQSEGTK